MSAETGADVVDRLAMATALAQARRAAAQGDVPVGCVIVGADGTLLAEACNEREHAADPTAHAEIVALRRAARRQGHWRMVDATLYVTLEPCAMCAGALVNARVARVVWGADDPKWGGVVSQYAIGVDGKLNHTFGYTAGLMAQESVALLQGFFAIRRRAQKA